ncbi:serine-aspartate repeat-containing protein F-like [Anopheles ziemanni]|uniref:serine-aspartate repeat-containing protein F-like n=1 Tax=Anopheles ziemanni TaxID=345580 RepID=UPI00265E1DA2|nr:serine-aspartate repeat-containing protein F-like [Anopheles ziemanni]
MASAKILQRAETAMEIGEDFLVSDEDDDDDADEGSENMPCSEDADEERGEGEDEADDATKSNASESVCESKSEQNDHKQDETASTSNSTKDGKTKMEQEKKSFEDKYKLNEDALSSMKEELEKLKAEQITNVENHYSEMNRLTEDLRKAEEEKSQLTSQHQYKVKEMEQEKKSFEDKYKLNEDALSSMKEELEKLKAELITNEENHYSEMNRLTEDLRKAQEEKSQLTSQHQYKVNEVATSDKFIRNFSETPSVEHHHSFQMASARILQRAETAMEIAGDFLFADEDGDTDDDADEGSENCSEDADAEGENDADDETKSNASESAASKSDQKDGERKENDSASNSTTDGKTKKSEKGVAKKLKSLMGVVTRPLGSKLQWRVDFNFEASNRAAKTNNRKRDSQPNTVNTADRKKTTRAPKDEEKPNSSIDAGEIKRLRKENKVLEKLADMFLDEYIQLKRKFGELSEVEGQLAAARSSYDSLKAELKESQSNRESLLNKMAKQSEEHRVEVARLNDELKKIGKDLSKMAQEKKSIEDKHKKNEDALLIMRKELENLSSVRDSLKTELMNQEEKFRSESNRFSEDLSKSKNEISELSTHHQSTINELKRDINGAEDRRKLAEVEVLRLQHRLSELENERDTLRSNLNSSTAKVNELRRAIAVLESNASTSTTVDISNKGPFTCPLCGEEFGSLANMQLHAEDCCT